MPCEKFAANEDFRPEFGPTYKGCEARNRQSVAAVGLIGRRQIGNDPKRTVEKTPLFGMLSSNFAH